MKTALPIFGPHFCFSHSDAEDTCVVDQSALLLIAITQRLNQRRALCVLELMNAEHSARIPDVQNQDSYVLFRGETQDSTDLDQSYRLHLPIRRADIPD